MFCRDLEISCEEGLKGAWRRDIPPGIIIPAGIGATPKLNTNRNSNDRFCTFAIIDVIYLLFICYLLDGRIEAEERAGEIGERKVSGSVEVIAVKCASSLRYEAKLDQEIRDYNPFGRGGGGAPMRDNQGNIVSEYSYIQLRNSL